MTTREAERSSLKIVRMGMISDRVNGSIDFILLFLFTLYFFIITVALLDVCQPCALPLLSAVL